MKLMMVEDNQSVIKMMDLFFEKENWEVEYLYDGRVALETFKKDVNAFDVITLDLSLPGMDGIQLAKEIKALNPTVPLIMLTARDSESDQVLGFEVGADDYVTKPFSPLALIARIKNLIKRIEKTNNGANTTKSSDFDIVTNHLKINLTQRVIIYDGKNIENNMTPKEFDLLYTLARSPKNVFTRKDLLTQVWDYSFFGDERTVDVHIKKLRKHFVDFEIQPIKTVWGVGYKYDDTTNE